MGLRIPRMRKARATSQTLPTPTGRPLQGSLPARRDQGDPRLPHARPPVALPARRVFHHPKSLIDSPTFGPGESYTANLIDGSGSTRGTIGDSIFHCHLYPHFADGFWGLFRTHDVRREACGAMSAPARPGRGERPQPGAPAGNQAVSTPRPTTPAPRFIPGKPGWRAPPGSELHNRGRADRAPCPPHRGRQAGADGRDSATRRLSGACRGSTTQEAITNLRHPSQGLRSSPLPDRRQGSHLQRLRHPDRRNLQRGWLARQAGTHDRRTRMSTPCSTEQKL